MIPIVKAHSTEIGQVVASLGLQVHGGMGYIEETGAAQHMRDARITTIYEGTTGIQANDLVGRKTARDAGAAARAVIADIERTAGELSEHANRDLHAIGRALSECALALVRAVDHVVKNFAGQTREVHAGAVAYLHLWGLTAGGWQMGRAALAAASRLALGNGDSVFLRNKIATARFYALSLLPQAPALARALVEAGESTLALPAEQF
jgi:hypothetical protein